MILVSNMCYLDLSVWFLFFCLSGEKEKIWSTSVGQPNSFSLFWPWFPSLPSVTAICALSSGSNLWSLLALLNKKRGLKAEGSIGPHQTPFFSPPPNWCQIFSGANPKWIREKEEDHCKGTYSIWSWWGIKHWHSKSILSPQHRACCMEAST